MITAEEKGITSANVDSFANSTDLEIRRLLGFEGGLGDALGLGQRVGHTNHSRGWQLR